jgi:Domain of unknown function (DUF4136)
LILQGRFDIFDRSEQAGARMGRSPASRDFTSTLSSGVCMNIGTFIVLAGAVLFVAGCSTIDVQTDYDPATNFTTLKTFKWVDAKGSDLDKHPLIKARIRDAVIATLKTKGYQQVESGEPDFFVFAHAGAKEKMNVTDWGYSYGAYWGPYGA